MYEQFNMLTLKPYKSGNMRQLCEHREEEQFSSNLWGTEKQIQSLNGRIIKGENGLKLKPWNHTVFNLNQTNLNEESLQERREKLTNKMGKR